MTEEVCPTCKGAAWDADGNPCPTCGGNGSIEK
jgi:DnaJ-class molecular chaperone